MVLDPFCGCATACIAAERLDRQWVGIDISEKAYELVIDRMRREVSLGDEDIPYSVYVAHVLWHDRLKESEVVAFGTVPLVGMGLCQGSNLSVDAIPGGRVTVTELSGIFC